VQQRRGDRAGRFAVPYRENIGAPEPHAGQPDREQPGLAVGRRRAMFHAAADIRGQRAPVAAGRARGRGDAVAGAPAAVHHVQRGHGYQPDDHRRTFHRQDPQLRARVPVLLLRPQPAERRPTDTRSVRYLA